MPNRYRATADNLRDYWDLFVNRRAYVLQSMRPHPESGRYYYFRPKSGPDGRPRRLTPELLRLHLQGELTLGLYAINPATQRCKWIAVDGDYKDSLKHLCELQWALRQEKVDAALEQSRRGAHLWMFGAEPLLARDCRLLVSQFAGKLGIPIKGAGTTDGIEIFPKHDELKEGDFGNAIRGPLGIHRAIGARFWFYGADYSFDNQLAFLKQVKRLAEDELKALIDGTGRPVEPITKLTTGRVFRRFPETRRPFRMDEHVELRRKSGRNWITRCPSCAAAGRDRGGDNLAISVDEPQKYICWAGCTKEMIRAALGCPIPEACAIKRAAS
jgi:hypothetical protein